MSFGVEDIINIMEEYDIDLLQLREAVISYRRNKRVDPVSKVVVVGEDIEEDSLDNLFNWVAIQQLEDPGKKH